MTEAMNMDDFPSSEYAEVPPLGRVFLFGPDNRKLQVTGLDWNDYSGELSIRMRPYNPAMTAEKNVDLSNLPYSMPKATSTFEEEK